MTQRLDYMAASPAAMKSLGTAYMYVDRCGLDKELTNLVYLRVSQVNGCAYCIDNHSADLLKAGVPVAKLMLVPVWREASGLFSEKERAALAWAEALTTLEGDVPDSTLTEAQRHFTGKELVDLTLAVGVINVYNRVGIAFRPAPPSTITASTTMESP